MRRADRKRAQRLRAVVETLPYETRVAMLEGLKRYEIIAGAYSERGGGVCPMLAAHRCGGRTDLRSFARAWDGFTGACRRARSASERELRTLSAQLETSLWAEDDAGYAQARAELVERRARPRRRRREVETSGAAWLVPVRDWDEYRRSLRVALAQLGEGEGGYERAAEPEHTERERALLPG